MTDALDLTALQALKTRPRRKAELAKDAWIPLQLPDLQPGTYLACDQSLTAAGLVLFEVSADRDRWTVHMAQQISVDKVEATGWEELYQRTETLQARMTAYVQQWIVGTDWGDVLAVNEHPPIGGGRLQRTEVSVITGYAFRQATAGMRRLPMVRRQDHCHLICGDRNAPKTEHHAWLRRYYPKIDGAQELVTNGGTRDALSVALFAARRGH